jgi:hypothetical protein
MQEVEQKKFKARQKRKLCTEQRYEHRAGMEEQKYQRIALFIT